MQTILQKLKEKNPLIMGILNVTPDSFSDGGSFLSLNDASRHALKMEKDGADIVDVGGCSTRPGSLPVDETEEIRRTIPVIESIRSKSKITISIDTTNSSVARLALDAGADMINDISAGRFDAKMFSLAADANVPICLMHMRGEPRTMQLAPHYDDVITEVRNFLSDAILRARSKGVAKENIIIDPGVGFGKTLKDNLKIISNLNVFCDLGVPVLIGTSRKSFIGSVLGLDVDKRLEGTLASIAVGLERGASILRVHDVLKVCRFVKMYTEIRNI